MIKEIKQKIKKRRNSKDNQIETLKEDNRRLLKKIEEKDDLIISLFYLRDEKEAKIKELLEELKNERERSTKKQRKVH